MPLGERPHRLLERLECVIRSSYIHRVRPELEYQSALELVRAAASDGEISRRLGIPRSTIREWRVGLARNAVGRTEHSSQGRTSCFRCEGVSVDPSAYAYFLGAYLGDGYLSRYPREVYRLRIACDERYPNIIDEIARHVTAMRGCENVGYISSQGCIEVSAYWKHWPCLLPQHGPGRKHERRLVLSEWQNEIVASDPKSLVRGLIHTDGNRHLNEVERPLRSGPRRYRYPRYMFTNASTDIMGIFTDALDQIGIHWTQTTPRDVSVARREDVAFLDTFIGPKS